MNGDSRNQALEQARALEKEGQVDPAVRAYLRAGMVEEAARVLVGVKRHADAGHLVMDSLGVGPGLFGGLNPEKKKLAAKGAVCFAQAGDFKRAHEMFLALGDLARAAEAAERAGDPAEATRIRARFERAERVSGSGPDMAGLQGRAAATKLEQAGQNEAALNEFVRVKAFGDAGRVAYKMKRFPEAGQHFEAAGMTFEAAACFAEAGDKRRCLDVVVRVPKDHPKYRVAAVQAIRASSELGALDFKLDHFIGPLVSDGPKDDRELEAFYLLAKLYQERSLLENARDVYDKITQARPGYRDVAEQLAKLASDAKRDGVSYEQVLREDSAFHGDARAQAAPPPKAAAADDFFPDLPELPTRPGAPARPQTVFTRDVPGRPLSSGGLSRTRAAVPSPGLASTGAGPAPASIAAPTELTIGSTVAERYRIDAKIGHGGMAAVYRATDLELGEEIAIKLFIKGGNDDPQMLARFKQELTLSRGLAHPNIVRLYDIGQHQGCRFISMELLQGTDLAGVIGGEPVELGRGLRYLIQAASGLSLAHSKGIIHRDIKPANFFVTRDDTLKVMDFGIAKRTASSGMTQTGFIAGTPSYMSPEQINNFGTVTHLTDLYALGVVAYEVFTGTLPFENDELVKLLMMHITAPPPSPRERNPAIPGTLEEIILRLLEKDPANRIQSCRELGDLLGGVAAAL